jgi:dipeptidase D
MTRVIELFKDITKVPRCSGTFKPFVKYIQNFAKTNDYICKIDEANNILCYKENQKPTICLQSHYDIVCLEDKKIPEVIEVDGYLKAKNSTLGADNGIGCAYMLALMEEGSNIEALFTCDEEIGLIGANNISFKLQSLNMLNLDSEKEGDICIGCAGGLDIFATNTNAKNVKNTNNKNFYEIVIDNLDGGHSGVDIDKNIPNAIKLITQTIKECNGDLIELNAGERINSIPKYAKAIIASTNIPTISHKNMNIKKLPTMKEYKKLDLSIIDFIYTFANGVRQFDSKLNTVLTSINLAIVNTNINTNNVMIELSARSMDNKQLKLIKDETITLLKLFNFEVKVDGKYPAWKPIESTFTTNVLNTYKKYNSTVSLEAIHAGLECAIFKEKYTNIQICSIGPNIYFPHSNREMCEINSVENIYKVLKDIVKSY